jgi:hypothetical protein
MGDSIFLAKGVLDCKLSGCKASEACNFIFEIPSNRPWLHRRARCDRRSRRRQGKVICFAPWQQVRDYRDAITFAETLPETDPHAHRYLGLKLQRRSRDGGRGNRSTGEVCSGASAARERSRQCTSAHPSRLPCRGATDVCRRSSCSHGREATSYDSSGCRRSSGAIRPPYTG